MARNLPATASTTPRVVYYVDPAPDRGQLALTTPAQLEARRSEQRAAILRWQIRQAEIAEHDRKVRRFWLGFGATAGTGVAAGLGLLVWVVAHAILAALPAILLVLAGLGLLTVCGHRCITIVQHWH
jgi:hypothetical protein